MAGGREPGGQVISKPQPDSARQSKQGGQILMTKIHKIIVLFLPLIIYFLFSIPPALAAEIFFKVESPEIAINQLFKVSLMLDTQEQTINAVEGEVTFSNNLIELIDIIDSDSIINLWVEQPSYQCQDSCQLSFSGISPGGFEGVLSPYYKGYRPGKIIDLVFRAKKIGIGTIETKNARALLNDGYGTRAKLTLKPLTYSIQEFVVVPPYIPVIDTLPPEPFEPTISRDPLIFNGQYFLVFITYDKDSGIDHYEVREGIKPFIISESPYLLKYQKLDRKITVKAVDKAGNERVVTLPPLKPRVWYEKYWKLVIITVLVLLAIIIWQKFKRK